MEWFSVSDRMPPDFGEYIATNGIKVRIGRYDRRASGRSNTWYQQGTLLPLFSTGKNSKVTHWMPLPEKPKM